MQHVATFIPQTLHHVTEPYSLKHHHKIIRPEKPICGGVFTTVCTVARRGNEQNGVTNNRTNEHASYYGIRARKQDGRQSHERTNERLINKAHLTAPIDVTSLITLIRLCSSSSSSTQVPSTVS